MKRTSQRSLPLRGSFGLEHSNRFYILKRSNVNLLERMSHYLWSKRSNRKLLERFNLFFSSFYSNLKMSSSCATSSFIFSR